MIESVCDISVDSRGLSDFEIAIEKIFAPFITLEISSRCFPADKDDKYLEDFCDYKRRTM